MTSSYRFADLDDRQFIVSGWSASYRMSRDISFIDMRDYAEVMHALIGKVLTQPRTKVIVAHGAVLQGFIAYQEPAYILYCYVAQPFRRNGIAAGLFAAAGIDPESRFQYAARTKASWECRFKIPQAEYDPYRIRFQETHEQRDAVR